MPAVHFTNLLIVAAAGLVALLALGFFPRLRIPAIVLGIVIGPSVLGWAKPDLPVSILALVGLAFLLFLAVLEFDVERLRGRALLRRGQSGDAPTSSPSPVMPVITAEDRALSHVEPVTSRA